MGSLSRWRQHAPVLLLLLLAALAALLSQWAPVQRLDNSVQDPLLRLVPERTHGAEDLVVIDIDEASLAQIGPWPWPRPVLAALAQALSGQGVKAQIWDLVLPEAPAGDNSLAPWLQQTSPPLVMGQVWVLDTQVQQTPDTGRMLASAQAGLPCSPVQPRGFLGNAPSLPIRHAGHLSTSGSADGVLRAVPAVICHDGQAYPQLVLAAAEAVAPHSPWRHNSSGAWWRGHSTLSRGDTVFALDPQGQLRIPYSRSHSRWPAISAYRLLDSEAPKLPLRGKWALVGGTAMGLADTVSTPYHPAAPGVSVHAELLAASLHQQWRTPLAAPALLTAALVLLLGSIWLYNARQRARRHANVTGLAQGLHLAWPSAALLLLATLGAAAGSPLPLIAPLAGLLGLQGGQLLLQIELERHHAQRLSQHLQSFLPAALARQIAGQHPLGESLGQPGQGTLLALQVTGMSRWSQHTDSLQALAFVHAVATTVAQIAQAHGGRLEYIQGPTFWVAWPSGNTQASPPDTSPDGPPQGHPNTPPSTLQDAHLAAHRMLEALHPIARRNETSPHPLGVRCVIESGAYLHGIVGQAHSRHSLLLGPAPDRLHCLLDMVDELACPVLIGPDYAQALQLANAPVALTALGTFVLANSPKPVVLYRSAAPASGPTPGPMPAPPEATA